jgi:hypothetical protein
MLPSTLTGCWKFALLNVRGLFDTSIEKCRCCSAAWEARVPLLVRLGSLSRFGTAPDPDFFEIDEEAISIKLKIRYLEMKKKNS